MKEKSIYIRIIMKIIEREAYHIQYQIRQNIRRGGRNNVKEWRLIEECDRILYVSDSVP
jgi:hypothetical protein